MKGPILVNEKISFIDLIFKYTIRDFILGIVNLIPSTIGVFLRMLIYPPFLGRCGTGLMMKELTVIKFPERVKLGKHVGINEYCWLSAEGGIEIGDYTRIAPRTSIVSFSREPKDLKKPTKLQGKILKKTILEENVLTGAGAVILAGVRVGKGSFIAPGSVVVRDVPPYSYVGGVPARIIKKRR